MTQHPPAHSLSLRPPPKQRAPVLQTRIDSWRDPPAAAARSAVAKAAVATAAAPLAENQTGARAQAARVRARAQSERWAGGETELGLRPRIPEIAAGGRDWLLHRSHAAEAVAAAQSPAAQLTRVGQLASHPWPICCARPACGRFEGSRICSRQTPFHSRALEHWDWSERRGKLRARSKGQGARSKWQGASGKGQGARGKGQRARGKESRGESLV